MPIANAAEAPNRLLEPLSLPCLFSAGGSLLCVTKKEALKFWVKRHLEGNRFLLRYGASPRLKVSFIIDRIGALRHVQVIGLRHSWAKPVASFYDLVLSECEIGLGEILTNAELLNRIRTLKADSEFPTARQLRKFLQQHPGDEQFDASRFKQFWGKYGPALPPSEWTEQYPP